MPLPIPTATPLEWFTPLLAMVGFGAYHGLNPGMGWLFALSLGLQQRSERAIWSSLLPITLGHAASLALVAVVVLAGVRFVSISTMQVLTALVLIGFGLYKVFYYYRHPRWVGMKVGTRDLVWWSFLMATAHGAGLMIAPSLLNIAGLCGAPDTQVSLGMGVTLGVMTHTLSMLSVMVVTAWVVYKRLGLAVLRQSWINFDLIWAVALLIVGAIALALAVWGRG